MGRIGATAWLAVACAGPATDPDPAEHSDPVVEVCAGPVEAVGARRLTRREHNATVSALIGAPFTASLPAEDGAWEGLVGSQAVTPALVASWWSAAQAAGEALVAQGRSTVDPVELGLEHGAPIEVPGEEMPWWALTIAPPYSETPDPVDPLQVGVPLGVVAAGRYRVTLPVFLAAGPPSVTEAPALRWRTAAGVVEVGQAGTLLADPVSRSATLTLAAGEVPVLELALVSRAFTVAAVGQVVVEGPLADGPGPGQWAACGFGETADDPCARSVIDGLGGRAWRRPLTADESNGLMALVDLAVSEGDGVAVGVGLAAQAILASPHFLLRVEEVGGMAAGEVRPASPGELAERLAFSLWAQGPDDELLGCATAGTLTVGEAGPCGLSAQVDRMLADPRSEALVRDFGRQWLGLDALAVQARDAGRYPEADAGLWASMAEGAYGALGHLRSVGGDLRELIDGDWLWADARLAAVYGVAAPSEPGPVAAPAGRAGLLGSAWFLALGSHPDRSSPVRRGVWVLDRLVCDPPDPAPPGIPSLPDSAGGAGVREALAAHRANPSCAQCHDRIDPLGLPFEGFDAIGRARSQYEDGEDVRTDAEVEGVAVADGAALAHLLAAQPEVSACLVRQVATWAWDWRPPADDAALRAVQAAAEDEGFALDAIARALVTADPFVCVAAPGEVP